MRLPHTITTVLCIAAAVTAHAAPGDLDTTFGTGGRVTIDLATAPPVTDPPTPASNAKSEGRAVAVQSDGKILIVGQSETKSTILRLTDVGALDTTFNTTGKTSFAFSASGNSKDYMRDLAIFPDGQIAIAGYSSALSGDFTFALGRLKSDGTVLGTTLSSGTRYGGAVTLLTDNRIVIVGHNVLARYTSAGVLDPTFDLDGRTVFDFTPPSQVIGVAAQPDKKIVAVGTASGAPPNAFIVGRYLEDGSMDPSFGTGGYVRTRINALSSGANRVAILPDGKIIVSGSTFVPVPDSRDFAVVRYLPDGSLDTTFNGTGIATANISVNDGVESALAVQPDGKILVGGTTGLVRLNADGTLDTSFSEDGKYPTDFTLMGLAMQPNGRILLTGTNDKLIAVRLLSGLGPDMSVEQPAGTILTSGSSTPVDFGTILAGETKSLIFTMRNAGAPELTGIAVTKAATGNPDDFTIGTAPPATLAPTATSTFTVSFASPTAGTRTATINVASNDADENPFTIALTARQASKLETWRQSNFGSIESTGTGADASDPDGDGLTNLMEFATGTNPLQRTPSIGTLVADGTDLDFTYTRPKAALAEVSYQVQSSATLATWGTEGLSAESILTDDGTTQQVKVTFSADTAAKRYVRLKVTRL